MPFSDSSAKHHRSTDSALFPDLALNLPDLLRQTTLAGSGLPAPEIEFQSGIYTPPAWEAGNSRPAALPAALSSGALTADSTGIVSTEVSAIALMPRFELGFFSLQGLETLAENTEALSRAIATRVLSNSVQGRLVSVEPGTRTVAATLAMQPGDRLGAAIAPPGGFQAVASNSAERGVPVIPNSLTTPGFWGELTGAGSEVSFQVQPGGTAASVRVQGVTSSAVPDAWTSKEMGLAAFEEVEAIATAKGTAAITEPVAETTLAVEVAGEVPPATAEAAGLPPAAADVSKQPEGAPGSGPLGELPVLETRASAASGPSIPDAGAGLPVVEAAPAASETARAGSEPVSPEIVAAGNAGEAEITASGNPVAGGNGSGGVEVIEAGAIDVVAAGPVASAGEAAGGNGSGGVEAGASEAAIGNPVASAGEVVGGNGSGVVEAITGDAVTTDPVASAGEANAGAPVAGIDDNLGLPLPVDHPLYSSGVVTVGETGEVTVDFLFSGGKWAGEVALFRLDGMEQYELGSIEFIQEATRRALSSSDGYVVINDKVEGARFSGELGERDWNKGEYLGQRTYQFAPGEQLGVMLVPNSTVTKVAQNPGAGGNKRPVFSLLPSGSDPAASQLADLTGDGTAFAWEDDAGKKSDKDYNDVIFQVKGATISAPQFESVVNPAKDWRGTELGQALIDYVSLPGTFESILGGLAPTVRYSIKRSANLDNYDLDGLGADPGWVLGVNSEFEASQAALLLDADGYTASPSINGVYTLNFADDQSVGETIKLLDGMSGVEFFYPVIQHRWLLQSMFDDQWYLENAENQFDLDVQAAWQQGSSGSGIVVAVVDDGIDSTHSDYDINPDYFVTAQQQPGTQSSWSEQYIATPNNPPALDEGVGDKADWSEYIESHQEILIPPLDQIDYVHGTAVAGLIAGNSSNGFRGVAHNATLGSIQLSNSWVTDAEIANAWLYGKGDIHIYNNSWKLDDYSTGTAQSIGALIEGAENYNSIYIMAGGNDGYFLGNVNQNLFASSRHTIAVGAIKADGTRADYSEPGASLFISAPSSYHDADGNFFGITTTDMYGSGGYNQGGSDDYSDKGYTQKFGGTSAAAALTSGVVALMLDANEELSWRDVQYILAESAVKNDVGSAGWQTNEAGYQINHDYGFGVINAAAAVNLSAQWQPQLLPSEDKIENLGTSKPRVDIQDFSSRQNSISVSDNIRLESVGVMVDINHEQRGDLEIVLTSPGGTESVLADWHYTDSQQGYQFWTFSSVQHWGESSEGDWTLRVEDKAAGGEGVWNSWELFLYGTEFSTIDLHVDDDLAAEPGANQPGDPGLFTLTRSGGNLNLAETVYYDISGSASNGSDYEALSGSVTFGAGQTSVVVPIEVIGDADVEGDETVALSLRPDRLYELGNQTGGTVTIAESATPQTVDIRAVDADASEDGNAAMFVVERTGDTSQALTVEYSVAGTATNGSDYGTSGMSGFEALPGSVVIPVGATTATLALVARHDYLAEGQESVVVNLGAGAGYVLGSEASATATIADSTRLSRYGSFVYVNPANGHQYILSEPDTWLGAQAQAEALGGNLVTINDGSENAWLRQMFPLQAWIGLNDSPIYGNTEGEFRWLNGASTYTNWYPGEPNNGGVNPIEEDFVQTRADLGGQWHDRINDLTQPGIIEIDPQALARPIVNVMVTDAEASEDGNAGQIVFTRVGDLSQSLTVKYAIQGSATNGVDYAPLQDTVTFAPGQLVAVVGIAPLGDVADEAPEDVVITLQNTGAYELGLHREGQVQIEEVHPVTRIAREAIGRDLSVFADWKAAYDAGESLDSLRRRMIEVAVEADGSKSTESAINAIYRKALGRDATQAEIADWRSQIESGKTLSDVSQTLVGVPSPIDTLNPVYRNPETGSYYFLTAPDTWVGAQEQAKAAGGNLATINDANEQQWLMSQFGSNGQQEWIGITDSPIYGALEGEHKWVNGEEVSYTNWHFTEPNNVPFTFEGEDFGIFGHSAIGEWNDLPSNPDWIRQGIVEIPGIPDPIIPDNSWIRQLGTENHDEARGIAVDRGGNVYIVGLTRGSLDGNVNASGIDADFADPLITKYDADGNKLWTRQTGTTGFDYHNDVVIANNGSIYTVGYADGIGTSGYGDAHLAKWDSDGNQVWKQFIGDADHREFLNGVTSDINSNIYVAGFAEHKSVSVVELPEPDSLVDGVVAKYDPDGNELWTRTIDSGAVDRVRSVATDSQGNLYALGVTKGYLGGNTHVGGSDVFLTKYDTDGNQLWTQQLGTPANESPGRYLPNMGLVIDAGDNIYISGTTEGSFSGQTNAGSSDVFVARYDTNGVLGWLRQFGTGADDRVSGLAIDRDGNINLTGRTNGSWGDRPAVGGGDTYILKLDSNGNFISTDLIGTSGEDIVRDITSDRSGNIYLSGRTTGAFEGENAGDRDLWVAKNPKPLSSGYNWVWTYFGEDYNPNGNDAPLINTPNSDNARNAFLNNLNNVKIEDFESYADASVPTTLNFGDETAQVSGIRSIRDFSTGGYNGDGAYPISGNNYMFHYAKSDKIRIDFQNPQSAFGFSTTDAGDANSQVLVTLHREDGTAEDLVIPLGQGSSNWGEATFFGAIDTETPFTSVTLVNTNYQYDGFGVDDLIIGDIKPEALSNIVTPPNQTLHLAYREDTPLNLSNILVTDPDGAATVKLTLSDPNAGLLTTATSGNVTSTYDTATGVWTASGAVSDINHLLANLEFHPVANSSVSISIATEIAVGSGSPLTGTVELIGVPENDTPTLQVEPTRQWVRQLGSTNYDAGSRLVKDAAGNLYLTGFVGGKLDDNPYEAHNPGKYKDGYLAKYSSDGDKLWTTTLGTSGDDWFTGVTLDGAGNLYTAGFTDGSLTGYTNAGLSDAILTKYDPAGNLLWMRQLGTSGVDEFWALVSDESEHIYTVGSTTGLIDGVTTHGGHDALLIKWSTNGDRVWTRQLVPDAPTESIARHITRDPSTGDLIVTGTVKGNLDGEVSQGSDDILVLRYDSNGNLLWSRQFGTNGKDSGNHVSLDESGNIYIGGRVGDALNDQEHQGDSDAFLAKLDPLGNVVWAKQFGTTGEDDIGGIGFGQGGQVYAAGGVSGPLNGNPYAGTIDAALVGFDMNGNRAWSQQFGSSGLDGLGQVVTGADGELYAAGRVYGSIDGQPYSGSTDILLAKYAFVQQYQENTPLELNNIYINDEDGEILTVTLTLSDTDAGTLTSNTTNTALTTFANGIFTVTGSVQDINAILQDLDFNPAEDYTETVKINTSVTDGHSDPVVGATITLQGELPPAIFLPSTPYLSFADSPFLDETFNYFHLETFEDDQLNTPGLSISTGWLINPSNQPTAVDSVDGDDGAIDGSGLTGSSWYAFGARDFTVNFDRDTLGQLPTHAGFALTDISRNDTTQLGSGRVVFEAFDANAQSLGMKTIDYGDDLWGGQTSEDRFLGVTYEDGIATLGISLPDGNAGGEIDHIQYGRAATIDSPSTIQPLEFFTPDTPYQSFADSPFSTQTGLYRETFEDGSLNSPGLQASTGILATGSNADSVEPDGASWRIDQNSATFRFDSAALGLFPTRAGLVVTDIETNGGYGTVSLEAFNRFGNSLGSTPAQAFGDGAINGTTAEDRFLGVTYLDGISSITITTDSTNWEVDSIQYG